VAYGAGLDEKVELVCLNKADTIDDELAAALAAELAEESGRPVFIVSGATGDGVDAILDAILPALGAIKRESVGEAEEPGWSPL
jgi:GTP-binding protein